jgi:DHA1 family bicyclomycin/chloramphenicol resistance-like MFS transporter
MLMSVGAVFPVNIIFPQALLVVKHSQGRSAAIILSARLIFTSSTLSVVSYFYDGTLFPIGLAVAMLILVSMFIIALLLKKGAIVLSS